MKAKSVVAVLAVLVVALWSCDDFMPINPGDGEWLYKVEVNKIIAAKGDSIKVTVHNRSADTIYLEGCNPIYYAVASDTGWVEHPMRECVWEGYARPIEKDSSYSEYFKVTLDPCVIHFVAPIYTGCKADLPVTEAECTGHRMDISSVVKIVAP